MGKDGGGGGGWGWLRGGALGGLGDISASPQECGWSLGGMGGGEEIPTQQWLD